MDHADRFVRSSLHQSVSQRSHSSDTWSPQEAPAEGLKMAQPTAAAILSLQLQHGKQQGRSMSLGHASTKLPLQTAPLPTAPSRHHSMAAGLQHMMVSEGGERRPSARPAIRRHSTMPEGPIFHYRSDEKRSLFFFTQQGKTK